METFLSLLPYLVSLLAIGICWYFWRQRNSAFQKNLEQRVAERTQALASINTALETEMATRREAEARLLQRQELLENQVLECTSQLQDADQRLQFEKMRLQSYNQQRDHLGEMNALLQASATMKEAGQVVKSYLGALFPGWNGALYAMNASGSVEPVTVWGDEAIKLDRLFSTKDCWALRRGKMYRVGKHLPHPACRHVKAEALQQFGETVCIPLSAQGESIGMLHFVTPDTNEQAKIGEEDLKFLEMAADSMALSVVNIRLRENLHEQSIRDPLTGLFNRRYMTNILSQQIQHTLRSQVPFSVMMLEIDNFRVYNNTYGHEAGNYVIKKLGDTLAASLRRTDSPCRYGGDEFFLILPDTPLEEARGMAEQIRQTVLSMNLFFEKKTLGKITVSIGVAEFPRHGLTDESILKAADAASYCAKAAGKNCVMEAE